MVRATQTLVLLLASSLPLPLPAQDCAVNWVDQRPMVLAKLKAGDKTYTCHLLLDLELKEPLFLHRNAARSLRAQSCDVQIGAIKLDDVPFSGARDRFLEGLTERFAEELHEVPVAGYLGVAAFGTRAFRLDGPNAKLAFVTPPPEDESVPLAGDPREGAAVTVEVADGKSARFGLHTRDSHSFVVPELHKKLGAEPGALPSATVAGIDFSKHTPFRALASKNATQGGLGGRVLRSCVVTLDPAKKRAWIEMPEPAPFPEGEAELCKALAGGDKALEALLTTSKDGPAREEAAALLFEHLKDGEPLDEARVSLCASTLLEVAPALHRANTAVKLLEALPPGAVALREKLATQALPEARQDQNGEAQHLLRMELGRGALARNDLDAAYKSLLSVVFGVPGQGEACLLLGQVHEKRGEKERARARYFQALLDAEHTGEAGLSALLGLEGFAVTDGATVAKALLPLADGRVPALHPVPREPEEIKKTGRVALLELYTGAQCPPCAGADLAFDAISERYDKDEIAVIVWHLPIPGPEPLVTEVGKSRAQAAEVRGTPTLIVDGDEKIVGGGEATDATKVLEKYEAALQKRLALPKKADIAARARRSGSALELEATVQGAAEGSRLHAVVVERLLAYPGRNGILFHRAVARGHVLGEGGKTLSGPQLSGEQKVTASLDLDKLAKELQAVIEQHRRNGKAFAIEPSTLSPDLDVVLWLSDKKGDCLQAATVEVASPAEVKR